VFLSTAAPSVSSPVGTDGILRRVVLLLWTLFRKASIPPVVVVVVVVVVVRRVPSKRECCRIRIIRLR